MLRLACVGGCLVSVECACSFPVMDGASLSWSDFSRLHLEKQPVVFTGLLSDAIQDPRWSVESLIREYGHHTADSSHIAGNGRKSAKYADGVSLKEFLTTAKPNRSSWFLQPNSPLALNMWRQGYIAIPRVFSAIHRDGPFLSFGQRAQSNGFHVHDHNWFAQIHGSKMWFAVSPAMEKKLAYDPQSVKKICKNQQLKDIPRCVLQSGQVIYVPSRYNHATCVLKGPSVAFAFIGSVNFTDPRDIDLSLAAKHGKAVLDVRAYSADAHPRLLEVAAGSGNLATVKTLLQHSMPTAASVEPLKPINAAVKGGHLDVVEFLAGRVDISKDRSAMSLLKTAALCGHVSLTKYFVAQGVDPIAHYPKNFGPAFAAAGRGHVPVMKYLVQQGFDLQSRDDSGMTVMHAAAIHGYYYFLDYLHDEMGMDFQELREWAAHFNLEELLRFLNARSAGKNRQQRPKLAEL